MKEQKKKIRAWLKLLQAPAIGSSKAISLVKELGEPYSFIEENADRLENVDSLSQEAKVFLRSSKFGYNWEEIEKLIDKFKIKFVSILDQNYPSSLKNIYNPPPYLFYRGTLEKDSFRRSIAIVGTRKASDYGKMMAKKIAHQLADAGFMVVSGLAYGIDSIAHIGCLESVRGITCAVMGTGCDQIYPPQNRKLAEKIIKKGVIISEYIPGHKAERWNFPERNRIISGLSLGCLVVEGSKKSGALLTARFAMDQNRDIFALPGDVTRPQAAGPNYLVQLGAKLVASTQDILDEYDFKLEQEAETLPQLTKNEEIIYNLVLKNKPEIHFDDLLLQSGMNIGELSSILLSLELKSLVKKVSGNKIVPLY
ncbi:MAG: DNA-processing protein DprA [Candidatus Cloacimonadota bacterium]|nr:DNA-processing protein DprA [Candidatus Cloacimonadota bacterium]